MSIPKIIHQTWKTKEIPKELIFCVESWKRLNPTWEYRLWTDEEMDSFVKKEFPEMSFFVIETFKNMVFQKREKESHLWAFNSRMAKLFMRRLKKVSSENKFSCN